MTVCETREDFKRHYEREAKAARRGLFYGLLFGAVIWSLAFLAVRAIIT